MWDTALHGMPATLLAAGVCYLPSDTYMMSVASSGNMVGGLKQDVGQHTLRDDNKYMSDVAESYCPCRNAMAALQPVCVSL